MMPIGPLMIEHRLIERMVTLMAKELQKIAAGGAPNPEFIRAAVDFIRTYADRLHHGKEENILFRDLARKHLSPEHRQTMDELTREHVFGREATRKLVDALGAYVAGGRTSVRTIADAMSVLVRFYPEHIRKEDKHFFIPVMKYFSRDEQATMLAEFGEFDRQFTHFTYRRIVSDWEDR